MSRWIAVLVTLLVFAAPGLFAQPPFNAMLYYAGYEGDLPLYTTCNGNTPIPDGRIVRIFQDADQDGPDDTDPLAPLCNDPPMCESALPTFSHNYNEFTMNGEAELEEGGYFVTHSFRSIGALPSTPYYYLRVYELDGVTVLWTSSVKTLVTGPQEVTWTRGEWTCGAGGPQCIVRDEQE